MKSSMLQGIADAKKDNDWYYVPPYRNEGHQIVDAKGQLVAIFEEKEHALLTVKLHNND